VIVFINSITMFVYTNYSDYQAAVAAGERNICFVSTKPPASRPAQYASTSWRDMSWDQKYGHH